MTLSEINQLPLQQALLELERICGAKRWCDRMARARPFASQEELFQKATHIWHQMTREDWLEAFAHHPRIGDVSALRAKFAATAQWASQEQAGALAASEETLQRLAQGNQDYEARFGHIFLVCATGKTAAQMLDLLLARMKNEPEQELRVAAGEQEKITRIRLEKWLSA
jgi:2-oxo-4-hydroxy-4-carboxy-5-ureidoimidazoline decarboxylase